jgi:hypothetical protein
VNEIIAAARVSRLLIVPPAHHRILPVRRW